MTGFGSYLLRSPAMDFSGITNLKEYTKIEDDDDRIVGVIPNEEAYFSIDSIDLSGIKAVEFLYAAQTAPSLGYTFEIRLDTQNGQLIGKGSLASITKVEKKTENNIVTGKTSVNLTPVTDGKFHSLYVITRPNGSGSEKTGIITIRLK
jgi:hypothetical protein